MKLCPCQSGAFFNVCCEPFIRGDALPANPVQLMRSRFSAFVLNQMAYIEKTQAGPAKKRYEQSVAMDGSLSSWQSLEIMDNTDKTVTFKASYINADGKLEDYIETSLFKKLEGKWVYFKCMSAYG